MTALTFGLALSTGALVGYCWGARNKRQARQGEHDAAFLAGYHKGVLETTTADYPVPEPVEMDGRETWGAGA